MIERLNSMTVRGIENCTIVAQTVSDLQQIRGLIRVEGEENYAEAENQQGE